MLRAKWILMGLCLGVTCPCFAQQGLLFSPSMLFYSYEDEDGGDPFAKVDAQYMDFQLGYIMSSGLYVGGLYSQMKREDYETDRERTSYGASLGLVYQQFFLIGHYIINSDYEIAPNTKLEDGTGFQANIGYWFGVTGPFYAGPQLVVRSIEYDKKNGNKVQNSGTSETLPYLSLAFIF